MDGFLDSNSSSAILTAPMSQQYSSPAPLPTQGPGQLQPTNNNMYANTQTGFVEIYTGATYGWEQVGGIASTVTEVTATNASVINVFMLMYFYNSYV